MLNEMTHKTAVDPPTATLDGAIQQKQQYFCNGVHANACSQLRLTLVAAPK